MGESSRSARRPGRSRHLCGDRVEGQAPRVVGIDLGEQIDSGCGEAARRSRGAGVGFVAEGPGGLFDGEGQLEGSAEGEGEAAGSGFEVVAA
jgi:hypothetical protein